MTTERVRPGEQLGYVERLRRHDRWPLDNIPYDRSSPIATPYLVVAAAPGDDGTRPLPGDLTLNNPSVSIIDSMGAAVAAPVAGSTYTLRCVVINLGGVGAYGGMAEFYVAAPADFDQAAVTPGATLRALGYAGFVAPPGASVIVDCPRPWTPATAAEAASSMVAQVYDPFIDPLIRRFDAREDRHVGRRDSTSVGRSIIIPYLSAGYKYLVVAHDEGVGFEQPGFDDSGFLLGDAGFGTPYGFCPLNNPTYVKTTWDLDTDILLRMEFDLQPTAANLEVRVAIDNDVQIFVNGHDISGLRIHDGCPMRDSFVFAVRNTILLPGTNLLAVRGKDRGGLSYLDVQVAATT